MTSDIPTIEQLKAKAKELWPEEKYHTSWDEMLYSHDKGFEDHSLTIYKYLKLAKEELTKE